MRALRARHAGLTALDGVWIEVHGDPRRPACDRLADARRCCGRRRWGCAPLARRRRRGPPGASTIHDPTQTFGPGRPNASSSTAGGNTPCPCRKNRGSPTPRVAPEATRSTGGRRLPTRRPRPRPTSCVYTRTSAVGQPSGSHVRREAVFDRGGRSRTTAGRPGRGRECEPKGTCTMRTRSAALLARARPRSRTSRSVATGGTRQARCHERPRRSARSDAVRSQCGLLREAFADVGELLVGRAEVLAGPVQEVAVERRQRRSRDMPSSSANAGMTDPSRRRSRRSRRPRRCRRRSSGGSRRAARRSRPATSPVRRTRTRSGRRSGRSRCLRVASPYDRRNAVLLAEEHDDGDLGGASRSRSRSNSSSKRR